MAIKTNFVANISKIKWDICIRSMYILLYSNNFHEFWKIYGCGLKMEENWRKPSKRPGRPDTLWPTDHLGFLPCHWPTSWETQLQDFITMDLVMVHPRDPEGSYHGLRGAHLLVLTDQQPPKGLPSRINHRHLSESSGIGRLSPPSWTRMVGWTATGLAQAQHRQAVCWFGQPTNPIGNHHSGAIKGGPLLTPRHTKKELFYFLIFRSRVGLELGVESGRS